MFVDTSALYAVLDSSDGNHSKAAQSWIELMDEGARLTTTNYVVVETSALVQRRLGIDALRTFHGDIMPVLTVHWLTAEQHNSAVSTVLSANRRDLSLVDCVSFELMRQLGLRQAFAFDAHFLEQGFSVVPNGSA